MSHRAKVWTALGTIYVLWGSTYLGIELTGGGEMLTVASEPPWRPSPKVVGRYLASFVARTMHDESIHPAGQGVPPIEIDLCALTAARAAG